MRLIAAGVVAAAFLGAAAAADEKTVLKVTPDEIAKEFKDDAEAAKKKYGGTPPPTLQISGTATLPVGSGDKTEVLIENGSKIPIRMLVGKMTPAKYPAKFTATATYKGYFDMAKELSLTASKVEYK